MQKETAFKLTRGQKKRYKEWAKKQLELYPYEKWVEAGNLSEEQLKVVKRTIEDYQLIAKYGYVKKITDTAEKPVSET